MYSTFAAPCQPLLVLQPPLARVSQEDAKHTYSGASPTALIQSGTQEREVPQPQYFSAKWCLGSTLFPSPATLRSRMSSAIYVPTHAKWETIKGCLIICFPHSSEYTPREAFGEDPLRCAGDLKRWFPSEAEFSPWSESRALFWAGALSARSGAAQLESRSLQLQSSAEPAAPWGWIPPASIGSASQCLDAPAHPFTAGKQPKWLHGFCNSKACLCTSSNGFWATRKAQAHIGNSCFILYAILDSHLLPFQ